MDFLVQYADHAILVSVAAAAATAIGWFFGARSLLMVIGVALVAVVVWFVLKLLFTFVPGFALPLLMLTALFLIVLVLIQRGKGGGLAGAFGGMGGQSAFGTKAGDLFTRVTIGVTFFWIILCMVTVSVLGNPEDIVDTGTGDGTQVEQDAPSPSSGDTEPAGKQGGNS